MVPGREANGGTSRVNLCDSRVTRRDTFEPRRTRRGLTLTRSRRKRIQELCHTARSRTRISRSRQTSGCAAALINGSTGKSQPADGANVTAIR